MRRPPASPVADLAGTVRLAIVATALVAAGCGSGLSAGGIGTVPGAETPRPSAGAAGQAAVRALRDALESGGFELTPAPRPWQPAQPAGLLDVPRSAYQVRLADPDDGFVVVYEFATPEAAAVGAAELAAYLSSGPGRITFPGDAAFHVGQVGPGVIMAWFAPSAAGDAEVAAAFELVASVGADYPVRP